MKAMQKLTRILMCCICTSLIISLGLLSTPARAAEVSSEFDFSAEDSIDAYDNYEKEETTTETGDVISRVCASNFNAFKTEDTKLVPYLGPGFYRYGAYLRDSDEVQRYYFFNCDWSTNLSSVCNNTLTIYADPEVKFQVTNHYGVPVINTNGIQNRSLVQYYNKTTENGHTVYFIELTPAAETNRAEYTVSFWTESETVQPHYSFWYGAPLVRVASKSIGSFTVGVSAPNRVSAAYPLRISSTIPERAWVNTVTIKKQSSSGDSLTSGVQLSVTPPNANRAMVSKYAVSPTLVFDDSPTSAAIAHDARGTYQVQVKLSWSPSTLTRGTYQYTGQMSVEYLYAFGA